VIVFITASDVRISNFTLQNSGWDLQHGAVAVSGSSENIVVSGNIMINVEYGVLAEPGVRVEISDNIVVGNNAYNTYDYDTTGILMFSGNCKITSNIILNFTNGILLNGNNNFVYNNTVVGSYFYNGAVGSYCGLNTWSLRRAEMYNQEPSTFYNTVISNVLKGSNFQFNFNRIQNWTILCNSFHGTVTSASGPDILYNKWDDGYPAGGNYWDTNPSVKPTDNFNGPNQDIPGADGICDKPVYLYPGNIDHYPLFRAPTTEQANTSYPLPNPTFTPPTAPLISTKLEFSCSSTGASPYNVTLRGTLLADSYPLPEIQVLVSFTLDSNSTWSKTITVMSDEKGNVEVNLKDLPTGNYLVRSEWSVNDTHATALATFSVSSTGFSSNNPFSIISNSTLNEINYYPNNHKIDLCVTGPEGTIGFTECSIAKSTISNIEGLVVCIDGSQIPVTYESQSYSWLISFTYHHSSHQVTLSFNTNSNSEPIVSSQPTASHEQSSISHTVIDSNIVLIICVACISALAAVIVGALKIQKNRHEEDSLQKVHLAVDYRKLLKH
jgi:hypothetical protein